MVLRTKTGSDTRVRAPRYAAHQSVVVETRTLGTLLSYSLPMRNLSRSGMLVAWQRMSPLPYQVNTLLELNISSEKSVFSQPVACIGKVVRMARTGPEEFGIEIVQIEGQDAATWEAAVAMYETAALAKLESAAA